MSTLTTTVSLPGLENYIGVYGSFHKNEKQRACEIASETIRKVIQVHAESIKKFKDLDEAGSYILSCVSDALEDKELIAKLDSSCKELFYQKDPSDFSTAVEWGAIEYLKDMLKTHRI